ncbi:methyltransferase domain-containing protein [bacterium]|nr:methyltransferase domain-containing protein [bacterium]
MLKKIVKRYLTTGFRLAVNNLFTEFIIYRNHLAGLIRAKKFRNHQVLKLNIGCGKKHKKGWLNIDCSHPADLTLDMREPLPFKKSTCSIVYLEHFLEHLDYPEYAEFFLGECYRVLKCDGIISIGVPDTEWPLLEYAGVKNENYFGLAKERWHPKWCRTEIEHINEHFRQGNQHRFAYDFKTLKYILEKVGFQKVKRRNFDPKLDSEERELGTLYADAVKIPIIEDFSKT